MKKRSQVSMAFEFAFVFSMITLTSWLPVRVSALLAHGMTTLFFYVYRGRRQTAIDNIRRALKLPDAQARSLAYRVYLHLADITAETTYLEHHLSPANMYRYVSISGLEHLRQAMREGRGVIFVTGHFGNWELGGLVTSYLCNGLVSVAQPRKNPWVEAMVTRFRTKSRQRIVPKKGAIRELMRELRRGHAIALLIDQDARQQGIIVPFFGMPASTIPAPAWLARSTGSPIIVAFSRRAGYMRYEGCYLPPIRVPQTGDRDAVVRAVTIQLNEILEKAIREDPAQWLWPHRRWKSGVPTPSGVAAESEEA